MHYGDLGRLINRCLHPRHGRGLLHFIGRDVEAAASRWTRRYVFPGFYLPTLREVLAGVLEPYGLSVIKMEDLRRHYTRTLEHWRDRFERAAPLVTATYGERFHAALALLPRRAHAGFAARYLQLFQVTFARRGWDRRASTSIAMMRDPRCTVHDARGCGRLPDAGVVGTGRR